MYQVEQKTSCRAVELDELSDKLFDYDNTPKYNGSTGYWKIGSGLSASEFEDITARYNRGENISAELAQKIIGIPSEISIYDFNSRGQYENTRFFVNRADDGLTFRTAEGFEITYSWEALGAALIKAAHKEFERHNELDRQVFEENTDRVITAVRNGETAGITLKKEKDEIVSDGHKPQFSNVKLLRNEENGFYITADTPQLEGGIIAVFGDDEKAVKDYVLDKGTDIYLAKNIKTVAEEKEETPVELPTQEVYLHDFSVGTPNTDNARQLSLFDEDVSFVMADSNAPAISQDMIDCVLRCGGNEPHSLERIVSQYQKNKGADSNTEFLRNEYGRDCFGIEYTAPDGQKRGRLAVTFDSNGIKIGIGDKADNPIANTVVTWEQAAQRIEELLTEGKYTSQLTINDAEAVTRKALADKLWYLHQDVQVEYFIPNDYFKGGFPDSTERISEALKDEKTVSEYIEGMQDFIKQYEADRNVLRFKFHKLPEMLTELQDLQLERRTFKTDKGDVEFAAANKLGEDEFRIEIGGTVFTERKTAGEVLQKAAIKAMATADGKDHIPIGKFCGFELAIEKIHNGFMVATGLSLRHNLTYATEMDISGDIGNITRLENLFNKGIEKKLTETESLLASKQTDLQEAMAAKGKPFEHAEELAAKSTRLEQLNRELEVGKADEVIMGVEEQETGEHDKTEEIGKPKNGHKH